MIVPEGWRAPALADLLVVQPNRKLVQQGWSPQCLASPAPAHAWGVLKTTAIQAGWFDDTQHKELPDGLAPRPAIEVKVGDLLITCAGPRARCGIPALVRSTRPRLMMSGKMYRFRPEPQLDAKYLEFWLLSPEAQRRIDRMKTGISDSGLNLTHSRFLQLPVPYPELLRATPHRRHPRRAPLRPGGRLCFSGCRQDACLRPSFAARGARNPDG